MLADAEFHPAAPPAVHCHDSVFNVREGALRHKGSHHQRIQINTVDSDSRERIVWHGLTIVSAKRVDVDSLFLALLSSPDNRWIGAPYLYAARIVRLPNIDPLPSWLGFKRDPAAHISNATNWVTDSGIDIGKVPTTASAEMPPMRVNAKPILVEVRISAVGAFNVVSFQNRIPH